MFDSLVPNHRRWFSRIYHGEADFPTSRQVGIWSFRPHQISSWYTHMYNIYIYNNSDILLYITIVIYYYICIYIWYDTKWYYMIWYYFIFYFTSKNIWTGFFSRPLWPGPTIIFYYWGYWEKVRFTHFKVKSQSRWRGLCLHAGMCAYIHTQT